ncbi:hypothetical protein LCGC14_1749650 [marine sediment metagenome]|uniref:Uncharacterized protein n=1 Tax=marine sediment metagenome TaxID=412755 RepID=A0A0F9H4C3_9ZZZZ
MDFIELDAKERNKIGKSSSRQLRIEGLVPAILYGNSEEPVTLQVKGRDIAKLIQNGNRNAVLKLTGLKGDVTAIIKDIQREHTKDLFLHLDLLRVAMDTEIDTALAIEFVGEAEGVKLGGVLQQNLRELHISALPKDIPEKYELDVSELEIGSAIKIEDLKTIPGVEVTDNPEEIVVSVVTPTELKEEEIAPAEEEELEEGAEAAEEGAEEGAEKPTQPERVGEEKSEKE